MRTNEGIADFAKQHLINPVVTDITKNTGIVGDVIRDISDKTWSTVFGGKIDPKKVVSPDKTCERLQKNIPDYAIKKKTYDIYINEKKSKNIDDTLKILNDPKNEEIAKFYAWKYYIDIRINKKHKDIVREEVIYDIIKNVDTNSVQITDKHKAKLYDFVDNKVIKFAKSKQQEMENALKKTQIKESHMSFKNFFESKEPVKEGSAEAAQKVAVKSKVDAAKAQAKAAQDEAKAGILSAKEKEKQAKVQAKNISTNVSMLEGTYAGADGVAKKIPFTQNPMLQNQAVGPKDPKAKDKKEEDKVEDEYEERKKKLEKISKELQDLADESCAIAKDNIDATEDTLIDKMAAREYKSLKEGASSWEEMEKHLQKLEEGCVGGVCGIGGSTSTGGVSNLGISPISVVGFQTQPRAENIPQVADRSTIYSFIKNNDLHRTNRDYALNALLQQFANAQTELSSILSDAILSDGNPQDIDDSYGFKTDTFSARFEPTNDYPQEDESDIPQIDYTQQGEYAQTSQLGKAWGEMENKLKDL
jgi:hypothetical protein